MRYLITFACYGEHLHGDEFNSVDRKHNIYGSPYAQVSNDRADTKRELMDQLPYLLDKTRREIVLKTLIEGRTHRNWKLWAAHIRTNHVHVVVEAEEQPEAIMNALKSYASRELNRSASEEPNRKRWARHGSTRWLWKDEHVEEAIRYVVSGQGESMELYLAELV